MHVIFANFMSTTKSRN